MRTIIDLPEDQVKALDQLVEKQATSRAALVRLAVDLLLEHEKREAGALAKAFGLWAKKPELPHPVAPSAAVPAPAPVLPPPPPAAMPHSQMTINVPEAPLALLAEAVPAAPLPVSVPALTEEALPVAAASVAAPEAEKIAEPAASVPDEVPPPKPAAPGDAIWPASFFFAPNKPKSEGEAS